MTKLSRKDLLKQEDAFVLAAESGAEWATRHRSLLVVAVAAVVVALLGVWGGSAYVHGRERAAAVAFESGWKVIDSGIVEKAGETDPNARSSAASAPHFTSEQDKWRAARERFATVQRSMGIKGVGAMAAFMVADLDEKLGEMEAAEKAFAELAKALPAGDHLAFMASERVAYCREKQGDNDGALAALNEVAGDDRHFYADYAQFHQARLYLAKKETQRARAMFEHLEKSFPNSSLVDDVRAELDGIGEPVGPTAAAPVQAP